MAANEEVKEYQNLRAAQIDEQIAALLLEARRLTEKKKKYDHAEVLPVKKKG